MIKIGTKKVNKIMIGNKEVLKIVVNGAVKYQKQVTPNFPYVLEITYDESVSTAIANFKIYDTTTGTQIGQTRQDSSIRKNQSGYYIISGISNLQYNIRDTMTNAGVHQDEVPTLELYQLESLNWTKASSSSSYATCWLRIADSSTTYYDTRLTNGLGNYYGTITNNDLTNAFSISSNIPIPNDATIKATRTQGGSTYNTYFTMNKMTLLIYFDYA
ncbi:MAG: hypothetical protein J6Y28_08735 [Acholeplasmatales bacterium]|nr:hypothetical protein [Acholeplasmatales bacterium]